MATQKKRILVVDDETNARTALAELLRDEGYDVDMAAERYRDAVAWLRELAPERAS